MTGKSSGTKMNAVIYGIQVLLAALFFVAAFAKLAGSPAIVEIFDTIGFGQWFRYFAAILEIVGGIGLLTRKLSGISALGLATVMLVAAVLGVDVFSGSPWLWSGRMPGGMPFTPNVVLVVCLFVVWARRAQFARFA